MQCISGEKVLMEHKGICLKINVKQGLKLRCGSIKFNNSFKQLAVLFKIYAKFKYVLKGVQIDEKGNNASSIKKYHEHSPSSFAYKVKHKISKSVVLYRGKMQSVCLLKQPLRSISIAKKSGKKHFNKDLFMTSEDERSFKSSNNRS